MPVSAAGEYSLYVHYMTGAYNIGTPSGIYRYDAIRGDEHPVIIPPGTSNTEILRQFENNTHLGTVSVGDTPTIAEPFRLLGYTFDGWYYNLDFTNTRDPYASATKYTGTITDSMVSDGIIDLYAKWSLYASPDITSDSVSFTLQNDAEEYVNDPIMWTNADGSNPSKEIDFQSDVTDYYGYVYGDVSRLKLAFEQYDPGRVEIQTIGDDSSLIYSYENQAYSEVRFNNALVTERTTKTNIKLADLADGQGEYRASTGMGTGESVLYLDDDQNLVSGVDVETAGYMELKYTNGYNGGVSELPDENIISVTVYMPSYEDEATGHALQNTKTYNFHIKRLNMALKPAYGNTPFGRIMESYPDNEARQQSLKDSFVHNHVYSRFTYTPAAWNIYGDDGVQVVMGSTLGENEYINYDEDDTAIVVTEGEEFNDPGVSLYVNGMAVDGARVERTIYYNTINSLRYPKWHSADNGERNKAEVDTITVNTKAPVDILKNEKYVKPGIYTIDYKYTPIGMGTPIIAHRNMIVLPKQDETRPYRFDSNMDNFINALDTLVYNLEIIPNRYIIDNVYLYRVLDVTGYGTVDNNDKSLVMAGTTSNTNIRPNIYPSLAINNDAGTATVSYNAPLTPDSGKAQLYMDFLGTDKTAIADMTAAQAATIDKTQKLNKDDVFYIGYRFTGVNNLTSEQQSTLLKSLTLSTSYDRRYVEPDTSGLSNLKAFFKSYDKQLYDAEGNELFDVVMSTNPYSTDKSAVFEKWNNIGDGDASDLTRIAGYNPNREGDTSYVRTMRLEFYLKDDKTFTFADNEYVLKIPMRVVNIPPSGSAYTDHAGTDITRKVLSAKLSASELNLSLGVSNYGYMWDTSRLLNPTVTENLFERLQYMGNYVPNFAPEDEPTVIEATYKEPLPGNVTVSAGIFEGNLPPGVTYEAGALKGTPLKAGDYDFYTNGVRYRMHVKKRTMHVIAEDKTMTYGDDVPSFTYYFNEDDLAKSDGIAEADTLTSPDFLAGLTTPEYTCSATSATDVGTYDINITLADSDNYTFVGQKGTLTIEKRPIRITDISKAVPHYFAPPESTITFSGISISDNAIRSEGEFTADDIKNDDDLQITYDAVFTGWLNEADKTCNIRFENIRLIEAYGKAKNYRIADGDELTSTSRIEQGTITYFVSWNDPQIEYTYGEHINLHSGTIAIQIKTGENSYVTQGYNYYTALEHGVRYEIWEGETKKLADITAAGTTIAATNETSDDREFYMPTVHDDNNKTNIRVYCDSLNPAKDYYEWTNMFVVSPMEITVRADDKERYYGDGNSAALGLRKLDDKTASDFTYSIVPNADGSTGHVVNEHNVNHDEQDVVLTDELHYDAVDADYEIHSEDIDANGRGKTIMPITMTYSGTNENYDVHIIDPYSSDFTDGSRLEILQRPITIAHLTAPTLKATDYILSDGTKYSPSRVIDAYAVAGKKDGENLTDKDEYADALPITLNPTESGGGNRGSGLYNNDPIKIDYNVRYVDDSEGHNYPGPYDKTNITVAKGMDTSFEKSHNYYIVDDITAVTGSKEIRRISDIQVIRRPKTEYIFGEAFELKSGEDMSGINADEFTRIDDDAEDTDSWIRITYDTGEVSDITFEDLCKNFTDNVEYNDNLEYTITINGATKTLNQAFMDDFNKNDELKHFNVNDTIKIGLRAKNVIDGDTRLPKPNQESYSWEWEIDVEKQLVHVAVDDKSTLYDRDTFPTYTCTITEEDFRWGQPSSLATGHSYSCLEDNNTRQADKFTPAGIYTINLTIPDTDNYTFTCAPATLTVRQRPLIITKFDIPDLSAADAENGNLVVTTSSTWTGSDAANNGGITFADGYKPFEGETVKIDYTYTYEDNPRSGGTVDVTISDYSIDRLTGDARNYYLQNVETKMQAEVVSAYIDRLEISYIRGKDAEGNFDEGKTDRYVYGDTLDISGMYFIIHYNSGGDVTLYDVEDLAEYGVKAEYYKKDGNDNEVKQSEPVKDGVFLTLDYSGRYIKLSLADSNTNCGHTDVVPADTKNTITVNKRPIHILVNNSSYTYGDNPPSDTSVEYSTDTAGKPKVYTYYLDENDFPEDEGKTKADFLSELVNDTDSSGFVAPNIHALTEDGAGTAPDNTTNATDFSDAARKPIRISADASSASSNNYTFIASAADNGILVVNRRKIKATEVSRDIIPTLTADIARANNDRPPITISVPDAGPTEVTCETDGISNGKITVDNMVKGKAGDKIAFRFDVVYNSVQDTGDGYAPVDIKNFRMSTDYTKYPGCKNYLLDEDVPTASEGQIVTSRISEILLSSSRLPTLNYTYGDILKIDNGLVTIKYTSGDQPVVAMDKLADYDIDIVFADNEGNDLTDTLGKVEQNKLLTVKDFNGIRLQVKPGAKARVEKEDNLSYYTKMTDKLTVRQKQVNLFADNLEMIYGDNVPNLTWHYNDSDLVNGDKVTSPRFTVDNKDFDTYDSENHKNYLYVTENGRENGTPVNNKTNIGTYRINWKSPTADKRDTTSNYSILYNYGSLTVKQKPLKISGIHNVPDLTPETVAENGTEAPVTIHVNAKYPDYDQYGNKVYNFTFDGDDAPLDGDGIEISYDAVYKTVEPGSTTVDIKNVVIETDFGKNKNYTVASAPASAEGEVVEESISEVEITDDPVMQTTDQSLPIEYKYGDALNLNRGSVKVRYNSGRVIENILFKDIEAKTDGALTLSYSDDDGYDIVGLDKPENNQTLYVTKHNGRHIRIKTTDGSAVKFKYKGEETYALRTKALKVNKAPITTTAKSEAISRIYGDDNPRLYCEYSGFVNGDTASSENFTSGLIEPKAYCEATLDSPVGEGYRIWAEGGESDNYYFEDNYVDGEIAITQRALDVESITGGIPPLTSRIIREEPGFVHVRRGYALNTAGQLVLGNLHPKDEIRISYDAIYSTVGPDARNITVSIDNVEIEDYGHGSNYYLRKAPVMATGGNVYTKKIASLDIGSQPKLKYVYGEYIDLAEPGVKIVYDDGDVLENVPYDRLSDYDVTLYITYKAEDGSDVTELASDLMERQEKFKNGEVTEKQQKMTTDLFTGAYYTLVPDYDDTIFSPSLATASSIVTKTLTVDKKLVNVNIHPAKSIYGEDPFEQFSFSYGDDYEYGETADEVVTTAPEFVCADESGRTVDVRTEIGEYIIRMTTADARNYVFHNNNKELIIEPRSLTVSNITNGIPPLTADIIKANMGEVHYIPAFADSTQMESNRVNDDDLRISYDAVYYDETKDDNYNVGIANMQLVEGYGRNKNYTLNTADSTHLVTGGGRIIDKEITEIEITEQPNLEYTYGETMDLSGGNVHIIYDTGYDDNVTFDQLPDYRVTPVYYDTEKATEGTRARSGDVLYVPEHDGRVIKLTARSVHDVEAKYSNPIIVHKRVLTYGDCPVNAIMFDGSTTLTTGDIIFTNMQNGDKVTATAVFNFEDYLAGEGKTVYITGIALDAEWTPNYELPATEITSTGDIAKSDDTVSISAGNVELSDVTNIITIIPPEMTEVQQNGGAKYEYSKDGGETWQESNVFEDLDLGTEYDMRIRFAETDNYAESPASESVPVTTYKVRITLTSKDKPSEGEDYRVLWSYYTNTDHFEKEDEFRGFIGPITEINDKGVEVEVNYYTLFAELEGSTRLTFPLDIEGETTIYTTLKRPSHGGGSGGGGGGGGTSFTIRYKNDDGSTGSSVPTNLEVTTDTKTLSFVGDTDSTSEIIWTSENETVATVTDGVVTILNPGATIITAYVNGNRSLSDIIRLVVTKGSGITPTPIPTTSPEPAHTSEPSGDRNMNIPYLTGYEGMIKPDDFMTRAEAATIMVQLAGRSGDEYKNTFPDVREGTWYIGVISEAAARGLISGFEDGTFRPEETVTREQFASMVARLTGMESIDGMPFTDVEPDRWSAGIINAAAEKEIISGYIDGTFLPENPIRRSEAARIVNVATDRYRNTELLDSLECPFSDLQRDHWAYYEFIIAAVKFEIP